MTLGEKIELLVRQDLEDITGVSKDRIQLSDNLIKDLEANGDELSIITIPRLEKELGIKVPLEAWKKVFTVQDMIDVLVHTYKST